MRKTVIMTEDGVEISALHRHAEGAERAVLLLHMMPSTKESWDGFAEALLKRGISSLAIDLRGHGESVRRGDEELNYKAFVDADHQASRLDVEAAAGWLMGKEGIGWERLAVAGASIGANLALRCAAEHHGVPACLALSPGLDYRGVRTEDAVATLLESQALFVAVAESDAVSFASVRSLKGVATRAETIYRQFGGAAHGTDLFAEHPDLLAEAVEWTEGHL